MYSLANSPKRTESPNAKPQPRCDARLWKADPQVWIDRCVHAEQVDALRDRERERDEEEEEENGEEQKGDDEGVDPVASFLGCLEGVRGMGGVRCMRRARGGAPGMAEGG